MRRKLSAANPYLRDPAQRERTLLKSVASSSAIEGIHAPFRQVPSCNGKFAANPKTASLRKPGVKRG
jgi:Fic family protein